MPKQLSLWCSSIHILCLAVLPLSGSKMVTIMHNLHYAVRRNWGPSNYEAIMKCHFNCCTYILTIACILLNYLPLFGLGKTPSRNFRVVYFLEWTSSNRGICTWLFRWNVHGLGLERTCRYGDFHHALVVYHSGVVFINSPSHWEKCSPLMHPLVSGCSLHFPLNMYLPATALCSGMFTPECLSGFPPFGMKMSLTVFLAISFPQHCMHFQLSYYPAKNCVNF